MASPSKKDREFRASKASSSVDEKEKWKDTAPQLDSSNLSKLELLACEIQPLRTDVTLFEKHAADIASLTESFSQLLFSQREKLTASSELSGFSEQEEAESSWKLGNLITTGRSPESSVQTFRTVPPSQHGLPIYSSEFFPVQTRIFAGRSAHHINYPVIPRWQDRARLHRIQKESPELLPNDLPPWSVRDQVPTIPQPDWSEEGRFLKYDGFSVDLFVAYEKALEENKVPIIPLPYSDQEMKRVLIEKGLASEIEVNGMMKNGRESWRGPMEGRENEAHRREMQEIEEGGKSS